MRYVTVALAVAACGDNAVATDPDPIDAPSIDAPSNDAAADAPPDAAQIVTCNADAHARVVAELNRASGLLYAYYAEHESFPSIATANTPATGCCAQNAGGERCCAANAADWSTGVWPVIGFALDEPQEFQFRYLGAPDEYWLWATGDRDCDDGPIVYTLVCTVLAPPSEKPFFDCRSVEPPPDID